MKTKAEQLLSQAQSAAKEAREIHEKADSENRSMTESELKQFEGKASEAESKKKESDTAQRDADRMNDVLSITSGESESSGHLALSGKRGKALASRMAAQMKDGSGGLNPNGDTLVEVSLSTDVVTEPASNRSLFDVIRNKTRTTPIFEYIRQSKRTNNAAIVKPGDEKPTSEYSVETVRGELQVFAHLSEPTSAYLLADTDELRAFMQGQLIDGLRGAVEHEVIHGDGSSGHLTGLLHADGVQHQSYGPDKVSTVRMGATKLEGIGLDCDGVLVHPSDWEALEIARNDSGFFDLGTGPVNAAERRIWGYPVALSTAVPEGTAFAFDQSAMSIDSDSSVAAQWSNAVDDDWKRNLMRCRVEGRFSLSLYRPLGVVNIQLEDESS
jgi:HK97 family phage major capsid protein